MRALKISISFTRYRDDTFLGKSNHILDSLTDNPYFATPNPGIEVLGDAVTRYSNALLAAADLGKNNVAEKNVSRQELEELLRQAGLYVMNVANGSLIILTSSGFSLTKQPEPQVLGTPGNVTLSNGNSTGILVSVIKTVHGARGYLHEITDVEPGEGTEWTSTATTTSKYSFKGLTPGKQYWVRVAATGARQQVAYSTVATQFAQ